MAAGAGWAWLREDELIVHVTSRDGPRGPLTAAVERVPLCAPGDQLALDTHHATLWRPAPPELNADAPTRAAARAAVDAHAWNDPRARQLGREPFEEVAADLVGRGPGLTPAGDDALCGYLYARRVLGATDADREASFAVRLADRTGEPSRSLLVAAGAGHVFEPAATMFAALVSGDGSKLAPAVRALSRLGRTTGRALLTGLLAALTADN